MNKIICDVCGTDYPETAEQCPICGCANAGEQTTVGADAPVGEDRAAYNYVKGGRFSKKNVNKRLKAMGTQQAYEEPEALPEPEYEDEDLDEDQEQEEEEQGSNLGLIIIVVILLLAIAAVSAYIAVTVFGLGGIKNPIVDNDPTTSTTAPTEDATQSTGIACTDLALSDVDIYLDTKGATWLLAADLAPADTTDKLTFTSTDESVVTVDPVTGLVTAVGSGEASIIVTCGDVVRDCPVKCELTEETTAPEDATEEPTEETTEPADEFQLKLDKSDFTLFKAGETCDIYSGEVKASKITWTTDNEDVATIKDGVVTAVGNGRTRVYGEYNGTKASCWVSCKLPEEATEPEATTEPEQTNDRYTLMVNGHVSPYGDEENAEVSIAVGETFRLTVEDDQGLRQDVTWKASKDGICSVEGRTVTGEAAGKVTLTAKLGDQTFKCVIIVK